MGFKQTQETQTSIPARTGAESSLLALLQQLAQGGAGQLGDLSALAGGQVSGPTGQDVELVSQTIGRARELAQRQLETSGAQLAAQGREQLTSRGVSGSSAEVLGTLLNQLGTQQSVAQSILGAQQQGGEALMNLPFMRGQQQLQANQALFQRILGSSGQALQHPLQERLAQMSSTTETSGFTMQDLMQLGQSVASLKRGG
jgi:hypothetical protein